MFWSPINVLDTCRGLLDPVVLIMAQSQVWGGSLALLLTLHPETWFSSFASSINSVRIFCADSLEPLILLYILIFV